MAASIDIDIRTDRGNINITQHFDPNTPPQDIINSVLRLHQVAVAALTKL